MENNLQVFQNKNFGVIRAIEKDGQPHFVGKDVAAILGYSDISSAVSKKVDDEDKIKEMIAHCQNGKVVKTQTTLINESGLYSLILSSKLAKAKEFKRWVTSEVLPSIRKTGVYQNKLLTPTEQLELQLKAMKEQNEKINNVDKKVENLKADMPLFGVETDELQATLKRIGVKLLGGYNSKAYKNNSLRGKVYADMQRELRRNFGVTSYKGIKRCQFDTAKVIIEKYQLPFVLADEIKVINNQVEMGV